MSRNPGQTVCRLHRECCEARQGCGCADIELKGGGMPAGAKSTARLVHFIGLADQTPTECRRLGWILR